MVGISSKMCITCVKTNPCFNYPNETQILYCTDCKKCGMVDVRNKKMYHMQLKTGML